MVQLNLDIKQIRFRIVKNEKLKSTLVSFYLLFAVLGMSQSKANSQFSGDFRFVELDSCSNKVCINQENPLKVKIKTYNFFRRLISDYEGFMLFYSLTTDILDSIYCLVRVNFKLKNEEITLDWASIFQENNNFSAFHPKFFNWMMIGCNSHGTISRFENSMTIEMKETNFKQIPVCLIFRFEK